MSSKVAYDSLAGTRWWLHRNDDGTYPHVEAQLAVLMDIREELKKLNALLGCHNFRAVPQILRRIARGTTPAKKKRKRRARR